MISKAFNMSTRIRQVFLMITKSVNFSEILFSNLIYFHRNKLPHNQCDQ